MGQDGIPISLAIIISAGILGGVFLIGMLFLALLPKLS
jgi:hypothetical protein